MNWLLFLAVLPPFVVSIITAGLMRRYAPRLGLLDRPGHRKVHQTPTPLGGGVAIWLGVVMTFLGIQIALWLVRAEIVPIELLPEFVEKHLKGIVSQMPRLWMLLGAGTVLVMLGLWDDRRGLDWRLRIGIQAAVAAFVAWQGLRLTFFIYVPLITGIVTVFWIVGLINSFNMLDNMDGLSGGIATIACIMLTCVVLIAPDPESRDPQLLVAGFLLVLIGAILGFLWHNRPPARIFMGDAGSYFLGFWLAVATILASFTGGRLPSHAILAPLLILAVPLYDTLTVVTIRLREGRSPFSGDKSHFSHRLVELGMTKGQAVATIYLTTATCGLGAFLLHQVDRVGAVIIVLLVLCVLTLIGILETVGRRRKES
ncbi:MAG: glycosyltransferase family 4 protein [Pirellulales bacterium]